MPWYVVRTKEVWDGTHLVEASDEQMAVQFVIEGHSEGTSEFGYLIEDDIECEETEPPDLEHKEGNAASGRPEEPPSIQSSLFEPGSTLRTVNE